MQVSKQWFVTISENFRLWKWLCRLHGIDVYGQSARDNRNQVTRSPARDDALTGTEGEFCCEMTDSACEQQVRTFEE
jgi:hypothetical protein